LSEGERDDIGFCLAAFSIFSGRAGWFCWGAASWIVGAGSDVHLMAAVFGGRVEGWYRH